jgi:hypothetical protein
VVESRSGNLLDFSDELAAGFNHLDLMRGGNGYIYFDQEAILKVMAKFAPLEGEEKINSHDNFLACKSLPVEGWQNLGFAVFLSFLGGDGIYYVDK